MIYRQGNRYPCGGGEIALEQYYFLNISRFFFTFTNMWLYIGI